jgi:ferredoxin
MMTDEQLKSMFGENISIGRRNVGKIRTIVVDRTACIGAQSCAVVSPHFFQMDEENLAFVPKENNLDDGEDENVIMGAESCPVLAIHLFDENDNKIFPKS